MFSPLFHNNIVIVKNFTIIIIDLIIVLFLLMPHVFFSYHCPYDNNNDYKCKSLYKITSKSIIKIMIMIRITVIVIIVFNDFINNDHDDIEDDDGNADYNYHQYF